MKSIAPVLHALAEESIGHLYGPEEGTRAGSELRALESVARAAARLRKWAASHGWSCPCHHCWLARRAVERALERLGKGRTGR